MWIESLHIDKFGKLRNFDLRLSEGMTVILGRNESGKTTVMAFLRAMLYGLNGKSASILQNDRKKYMPWGETSMGGSLRLTDGSAVFEVARVFGQTKKLDSLRVTELATGDPVEIPAGDEVGRVLLGVDEAVFAGTLYVSARGSRPDGDGAALTEKIKNLIGTGAEDVDLGKIMDRLRAARSEVAPRVRDKGSLNDTREEMAQVRRELLEGEKAEARLQALRREVEALSTPAARADAGQTRSKMAEKEAAAARRDAYLLKAGSLDGRIRELKEEIGRAQGRGKPPRGSALTVVYLVLAILVAALSVAGGLLIHNAVYAGLILTAGIAVLYMRQKDKCEAAMRSGNAAALKDELSAAQRERAMYFEQAERLGAHIARLGEQIESAAGPAQEDAQERLVAARVEMETLLRQRGDPEARRARLTELQARERALQTRLDALTMAQEELMLAARERQGSFVPALTGRMEGILSHLTAGKYVKAAVNQSLELSLQPESGAMQPWDYFSGGTVEMMYLALRFALLQMMEKRSGPLPALLDDPFALFDDERTRAALELTREFAQQGRQVLLFTCQERNAQLLGGARVTRMPG